MALRSMQLTITLACGCCWMTLFAFVQVSLSGKNKSRTQETKQDFLERTRRDREAREVQRRKDKAALDIQVELCFRCSLQIQTYSSLLLIFALPF